MKKITPVVLIVFVLIGGFFYFHRQAHFSRGDFRGTKTFEISKGERNPDIAERLESGGLIASRIYFYYYFKTRGLSGKILPGEYLLSGEMTIPEIASVITSERKNFVKITFPEGWGSKKMSERLSVNGFDGQGFLEIAENPEELKKRYAFLQQKNVATLEGYLFPDTYFFSKDTSPEAIVEKMLDNFDNKINTEIKNEIQRQNRTIRDVVILASIIEGEVRTDEDRKIASGIFWKRIKEDRPLQSCATLAYILGENKKQYSFEDTRTVSSFNTYLNKGLPPAPIGNPGMSAISAVVYSRDSAYNYFLSDPESGKTVFSRTIEEHNTNKVKYGL